MDQGVSREQEIGQGAPGYAGEKYAGGENLLPGTGGIHFTATQKALLHQQARQGQHHQHAQPGQQVFPGRHRPKEDHQGSGAEGRAAQRQHCVATQQLELLAHDPIRVFSALRQWLGCCEFACVHGHRPGDCP